MAELTIGPSESTSRHPQKPIWLRFLWKTGAILALTATACATPGKGKDSTQYGMGLIVNLPFPEAEVTQVVRDVIQNGIIRGTKEYNRDEFVSDAQPAESTRVFADWTEGGKVFYKIRLKALDPRNFKDSSDVGTLAVRYVVQPQGDKNTVLRIDARFVEDFRHVAHASNGSVESAEYKDIHDRLDDMEVMKTQTVDAQRADALKADASKQSQPSVPAANQSQPSETRMVAGNPPPSDAAIAPPARIPQTLEERVKDLRHQVQRAVKAPGAPLKSAPFHTATTLQSLPAGTEVLVVISTTYWLGVETHDGQHGWMLRDDLDFLP